MRSAVGDWFVVERSRASWEPDSLAFRDRRGQFFEYEPATGKLHATIWLTDLFRYPERRSEGMIVAFTPVSRERAAELIRSGFGAREDRRLRDGRKRDTFALNVGPRLGGGCHTTRSAAWPLSNIRDTGDMTKDLSEAAGAVVALSQEAARELGSPYTGAEHLVLGLLKLDAGSSPSALSALGLSYRGAKDAVVRFSGIEQDPGAVPPPLSPTCLSTLERARNLARARGSDSADTHDVLAALLDPETFGVASDRFLWELAKDAEAVGALRRHDG